MKKTITLLLILISHFASAQENEDEVKLADSLQSDSYFTMLEFSIGHANHNSRQEGNHLSNGNSTALSLRAGFKTSNFTYFKSGVDLFSDVSFLDYNYTSYRIPLLAGVQFDFKNSSPLQASAFIDTGIYYRKTSINSDANSITTNSTYGLQSNMGFQIPLSANLYAILLFNINVDFDEAIEIDDDEVQLLDTSLQIGLGYRF
ncbi:MAG: hypothetical protein LAT51_07875 [Flavobacteriaceae bacterium]|nr:hypothetical protein [Flavobacteriaceae bacterium]